MNTSFERHTDTEPIDIKHLLETLRDMLPEIAKDLIISTHDATDPLEQGFIANPDSPAEHSPRWHQYGILTHSEKFRVFVAGKAVDYLKEWNVWNEAEAILSEEIDGISKADLLQIGSLLHDLGKFTVRRFERKDDGTLNARFVGHEEDSGTIIRTQFKDMLKGFGLTEAQIEYIAQCAEHHFDLGKARQIAIDTVGYTMEFAKSEAFKEIARGIVTACPDYALEIGIMFLADSFSKTQVAAVADTDEQIRSQKPDLEQEIKANGINPRIIEQATQQPVNLEVGKQYLQEWVKIQRTLR